MQIEQTRYGAATGFGAGLPHQSDGQHCRSMDSDSTILVGDGSFDPEAIDLLQAALDEAWASLPPSRRAWTSRIDVARQVLELAARVGAVGSTARSARSRPAHPDRNVAHD
jgi:hypothetical protein